MKYTYKSFIVQLLLLFWVNALSLPTFAQNKDNHSLTIWDDKPAKNWMTEAYPIGNGRIGGMIFGGVNQEHIQFNDNTLWTGNENDRGAYQAFGDIFIDFKQQNQSFSNYRRELDLTTATHHIDYIQNDIKYNRAYFCSFPDKVMVLKFRANKKAAYSAIIKLKDKRTTQTSVLSNRIQFSGKLSNGMPYQATAVVQIENGTSSTVNDENGNQQIKIDKADAITIIFTAATNYSNKRSENWKGEEPAKKVDNILKLTEAKTYKTLLANHLKDYQKLFSRLSLKLGNNDNANLPTYQRLINYKKTTDPALEALIYQYGRYLLISSSRPGGLPANLQGLWNESNDPPWGSDYHSNINIQMNYWLAEPTNLSECHIPYLDYINSIREVAKMHTQKKFPNTRGWTVQTENNVFGGMSYLWNTPGSAWYAQALWEHYAFTLDKEYLRNFAYPILKEISAFWDDHLKRRPDGTLVSPLGWSPEHGPIEDGVTHDQQIVYDLFTNYITAAKILGIDSAYQTHIKNLKAHLLKPKIGKWGQLQEWETDRDDPKDKHRHVSHLFGLHPGKEISLTKTPELAQAAKVSLTARGDESTGWSMAWKINFWARLKDGDHAYKILQNFITPVGGSGTDYNKGGGIYANLFCAHPPFQIDGNFGATAGITEMLLQSQDDFIELLPALPKAWKNGEVKGLVARGNFELNLKWDNGELTSAILSAKKSGVCNLRYKLKAAKLNAVPGKKYELVTMLN